MFSNGLDVDKYIADYSGHKQHLPSLIECCNELDVICRAMEIGEVGCLAYRIVNLQCVYLLSALSEINTGIVRCLENKLYTSVEALSRVAVEHTVNLMYITGDDDNVRSLSLLYHHVAGAKRQANNWLAFSKRVGDDGGVNAARDKLEHLNRFVFSGKATTSKKLKKWPRIIERFKSVGLESLYHVFFSPTSDSVHTLSEDLFNITILESYPEAYGDNGQGLFYVEKESFAYYHATNAQRCFAEAAAHIAKKIDDNTALERIIDIGGRLNTLIMEHENHHKIHVKRVFSQDG